MWPMVGVIPRELTCPRAEAGRQMGKGPGLISGKGAFVGLGSHSQT